MNVYTFPHDEQITGPFPQASHHSAETKKAETLAAVGTEYKAGLGRLQVRQHTAAMLQLVSESWQKQGMEGWGVTGRNQL